MSRNVPASLPSRNATSGSISSDDASALAFFAIRCDSTASWFVYSISRRLPPPWPTCCAACWASSRIALLPWLMFSRPFASEVRLCWLSRTRSALTSTRSQRRLDVLQQLDDGVVRGHVERHALDRAAGLQRVEVRLEAVAAVLQAAGTPRPGPAPQAPCRAQAAAKASAFRSPSLQQPPTARRARPSRNSISAANTRNVTMQHAQHLELLDDRQVPDQPASFCGIRISDVAERSCSMIDTDASGS